MGVALRNALLRAEQDCLRQGENWTYPRRRVFELLLRAGVPVKAYDLAEDYKPGRRISPATVYRALWFLERIGLVRRIASLNAYIAYFEPHRAHTVGFMICEACGATEQFEMDLTSQTAVAKAAGFHLSRVTLEVRGLCAKCS
jgi:Fur family zinc uptake transcriptional regulator